MAFSHVMDFEKKIDQQRILLLALVQEVVEEVHQKLVIVSLINFYRKLIGLGQEKHFSLLVRPTDLIFLTLVLCAQED